MDIDNNSNKTNDKTSSPTGRLGEASIFLHHVRFHARHGVLPQELIVGNDYVVDMQVDYDFSRAMKSDDLNDTLNYATLYRILSEEMQVPSQLLERVSGRIADRLFRTFPAIESLHLRITKENPPIGADCDGAGVEIHLINNKTNNG